MKSRRPKVRLNLRIDADLDEAMRELCGTGRGAVVDFIEEALAREIERKKRAQRASKKTKN